MSMIFSRSAIIPVWLVVFALFAWSAWPMPVAMATLLVIVGVAVPVIIFMLGQEAPLTVAAVLNRAEQSGKNQK